MQAIPATCAYSPEGATKVLLFFLPLPIEQRVITILKRSVQAISELYYFPDECIIPTSIFDISLPSIDLKVVLAVTNGSEPVGEVAREAKAKVAWANIDLFLEEMEASWAVRYAQFIQMAKRISNVN